MISRHWTCVTHRDGAEQYERHLLTETLPAIREIEGFMSAPILRRDVHDGVAHRIVTEWTSMEAVRAFAGADADTAVVPEKVHPLMIRFDERVETTRCADLFLPQRLRRRDPRRP